MKQYLVATVAQPRLNSTVVVSFAVVAVLLAALGVYAVMVYSVVQREHEIGIRIALGAQRSGIFRLLLRSGMRLIGISIAIGWPCALLANHVVHRFGYGFPRNDVLSVLFATGLLLLIGLLACWLPAKRASEIDPLAALGQR